MNIHITIDAKNELKKVLGTEPSIKINETRTTG